MTTTATTTKRPVKTREERLADTQAKLARLAKREHLYHAQSAGASKRVEIYDSKPELVDLDKAFRFRDAAERYGKIHAKAMVSLDKLQERSERLTKQVQAKDPVERKVQSRIAKLALSGIVLTEEQVEALRATEQKIAAKKLGGTK